MQDKICSDTEYDLSCNNKFWLRHLSDQSGNCTGQHQKCQMSDCHLMLCALVYSTSTCYLIMPLRNGKWDTLNCQIIIMTVILTVASFIKNLLQCQ